MSYPLKIKYIEGLKNRLNLHGQDSAYEEIVRCIDIGLDAIGYLCFWNPESYSRISLYSDSHYSISLLCWEKNQSIPITCGRKEESIYMVDGLLLIERFDEDQCSYDEGSRVVKLSSKDILCVDGTYGLYRLVNNESKRSVSLHVCFYNK